MFAEVVIYLEVPNGTKSDAVCRAVRRAVLCDAALERDVQPITLFPARCRFVDAPPVASDALPPGAERFGATHPLGG